jgi:endonuclease/exonuclease/phosphatase family metal-dependent hydrolase
MRWNGLSGIGAEEDIVLHFIEPVPEEYLAEYRQLCAELDRQLPPKALDTNLLLASWNLRGFGDFTEDWVAGSGASPKRDKQSLLCIAEIVSRFDAIAIQEVRGNLRALRYMLRLLGTHWGFSMTDVTRGAPGNDERMAYLFDTRKLQLSGLACELVVPAEKLSEISQDALTRQFARTPYAVSFRTVGHTFILVTLHVLYGDNPASRVPELKAIAGWLADWARNAYEGESNLIALGDFNIDRQDDALYQAFTSTGLFIPEDLHRVPRTLFSDPEKPNLSKFYDQIAWFPQVQGRPAFSLRYNRGGSFDFTRCVLQSRGLDRLGLSWRISDHYPLWAEFLVR